MAATPRPPPACNPPHPAASHEPAFLALNPNGKIAAIIDPHGPGDAPLALFESGAIVRYLAEKTGQLLPADPALRYQTIQWVFFQMAAIGPMLGQPGFFHEIAGKDIADQRPPERRRCSAASRFRRGPGRSAGASMAAPQRRRHAGTFSSHQTRAVPVCL